MVRNRDAYAGALQSQSLPSLGLAQKSSVLCNQFLIHRYGAGRDLLTRQNLALCKKIQSFRCFLIVSPHLGWVFSKPFLGSGLEGERKPWVSMPRRVWTLPRQDWVPVGSRPGPKNNFHLTNYYS